MISGNVGDLSKGLHLRLSLLIDKTELSIKAGYPLERRRLWVIKSPSTWSTSASKQTS